MRLDQLLYCIEVARCHSITQAAKKLYMAQPALSTAIHSLENELGFAIFERVSGRINLTEKGATVVAHGEIIAQILEGIKDIASNDMDVAGTVTISAIPSACSAVVTDLIYRLERKKYNINVHIVETRLDKVMEQLISNQADIIIGGYLSSQQASLFAEARKHNIVIDPVFQDYFCAFLARQHPKSQQPTITLDELKGERNVVLQTMEYMRTLLDANMNYCSFSSQEEVKQCVALGLGVSILPSMMGYRDVYVDSGKIVVRPITDIDEGLMMYVAYKQEHMAQNEAIIMDLIKQIYQVAADEWCQHDSVDHHPVQGEGAGPCVWNN